MQPIHLIVNPRSGYGGQQPMLSELRHALRRAGMEPIEQFTAGPNHAVRLARDLPEDAEAVMVVGGDGTINEVVNGLAGRPIPMAVVPAGTENLLAKELHLPADPAKVVKMLCDRRVVACDVGSINGHCFLLIIGVGFDGEVVRRLAATRTGHISHLSYFWPLWRTFWEHDFPQMRITEQGQEIFNGSGLAFVGNISRYAVGLRICRDADFNDGLLDLVVFRCGDQPNLLLHAAMTLLRRHPLRGNVLYRQVRDIRIETDHPVPTQIDGDPGPATPVNIKVLPGQARLIVPTPRHGRHWPWRNA